MTARRASLVASLSCVDMYDFVLRRFLIGLVLAPNLVYAFRSQSLLDLADRLLRVTLEVALANRDFFETVRILIDL